MESVEIIGITSNSLKTGESFFSQRVLGDDDFIVNSTDPSKVKLAMGLGGFRDNSLRKKVFEKMKSHGFAFINAIHPQSIYSKTCKLGEGITICAGAVLSTEAQVGDNTIISTSASVDHETIIGSHVLLAPGVTVGAYAKIGNDSLLALGSKVVSGAVVGENNLIAAGAVVVNNTLPNSQLFGVPAKNRSMK
jgi:UDP-perosamine 4-acetyltransferase